MPLVFAAIAPHGSMAIAEWCKPEDRELAAKTRAAMEQLGRRFAAASPEVMVVLTPHNIHVEAPWPSSSRARWRALLRAVRRRSH